MTRLKYKKLDNGCEVACDIIHAKGFCHVIINPELGIVSISDLRLDKSLYFKPIDKPITSVKKEVKTVLKSLGVEFSDEVRNTKQGQKYVAI